MTFTRPSDTNGATRRRRVRLGPDVLVWVFGAGAGLLVVAPAFGADTLLSLDLVLTDHVPMPDGIWGLGHEFPRAMPLWIGVSGVARVVGAGPAGALLLGGAIAAAFAGASRLVSRQPTPVRLLAGAIYALSPFVLTRVGVGHLGVVWSVAVLPWALPTLMRPSRDPARTFLWAFALGVAGLVGALYAAAAAGCGLVLERPRRTLRVAGAVAAAQLPWLAAGFAVWVTASPDPAGSTRFSAEVHGPLAPFELLAGHGFWREGSQVGGDGGLAVSALGAVLTFFAVIGWRRLPADARNRVAALGAVGLVAPLLTVVPGVSDAFHSLTRGPAVVLREPQRLFGVALVALAPTAALGAAALARRLRHPGTLWVATGAVAVLAVPAIWGVGGQLDPVTLPAGWSTVREAVRGSDGTTLALPWHRYLDVGFAGGRRVLNPLPQYLGGDVIASSDPEFGGERQEALDPREARVRRIVDDIEAGRPVASDLQAIGIRWVVLAHEADWDRWSAIAADPDLRPAVSTPSVDLYEVTPWRGPALSSADRAVDIDRLAPPLARADSHDALVWQEPYRSGWMRGSEPASRDPNGLLRLPANGGVIWYWPAVAVVLVELGVLVALVVVLVRLGRRRTPTVRA